MPSIKLDEIKGLEPVPAGTYIGTITKATEGVSKSGNEKIDVQWTLEYPEDPKIDGRIIFDTLVWHEKSLFRVKQVLLAGGYEPNFEGEITEEDLVGITGLLVVDIEDSTQVDPNGEPYPPRNRVKRVKPVQ